MLLSLFLRLYTYCHGISYYHAGIREGREERRFGGGVSVKKEKVKLRLHDGKWQVQMIHECVTLTRQAVGHHSTACILQPSSSSFHSPTSIPLLQATSIQF